MSALCSRLFLLCTSSSAVDSSGNAKPLAMEHELQGCELPGLPARPSLIQLFSLRLVLPSSSPGAQANPSLVLRVPAHACYRTCHQPVPPACPASPASPSPLAPFLTLVCPILHSYFSVDTSRGLRLPSLSTHTLSLRGPRTRCLQNGMCRCSGGCLKKILAFLCILEFHLTFPC